jgi:hypothetical protein
MRSLTRFLLFLLLLAMIAAAALWIIGGKKDEYSISLVIDAHPNQVFPYLTQPDLLKQWASGLVQVEELRPLADGSNRTIKTTRIVVDQSGKRTAFEDEVLRHSENEAVTVQSSNAAQVITAIYQLDLKDNRKTVLTHRVKVSNVGIGRLLGPLQRDDVKSQMENEARQLKELVETNEPQWEPSTADEPVLQVPSFGPENLSNSDPNAPIDPSQPHVPKINATAAEPSENP